MYFKYPGSLSYKRSKQLGQNEKNFRVKFPDKFKSVMCIRDHTFKKKSRMFDVI